MNNELPALQVDMSTGGAFGSPVTNFIISSKAFGLTFYPKREILVESEMELTVIWYSWSHLVGLLRLEKSLQSFKM